MRKSEIVVRQMFTARDAADFVDLCNRFQSEIVFCQPFKEINAKSLMGMIALALKRGDSVLVMSDGPDEEEALAAVCGFFDGTGRNNEKKEAL